MFEYELLENPYRPDNWYGDRFDYLYDLNIYKLRYFKASKENRLFKK